MEKFTTFLKKHTAHLLLASFILTMIVLWIYTGEVRRFALYSFSEPREDMSHGYLVPFFSLALLFLRRKELKDATKSPSIFGLILFFFGLIALIFGIRGDQIRITQVATIYLIWASTYAIFGKAVAKLTFFPCLYLFFTVPMSFLDGITVKLRFLASSIAAAFLNGIGIPVLRTGTGLHCAVGGGFALDVADPCSGMRSIFALTALTAAYAYVVQKSNLGKWLLFICSIPIAVIGNIIRISSIAIVATIWGEKTATGFYHDYSGFIVFFVGVLIMLEASKHILKLTKSRARRALYLSPTAITPKSPISTLILTILAPALLFTTGHILSTLPEPYEEPNTFISPVLGNLPHYTASYPWYCQNEQCANIIFIDTTAPYEEKCPICNSEMLPISLGEKTALPEDTGFRKCRYRDTEGDEFMVSVVINGKSRSSIHRPEICFPAQGFSMEDAHDEIFNLEDGTSLQMHIFDIRMRTSSSTTRGGACYFFVSPTETVCTHLKRILISIRDRVIYNKITRWAMIAIVAPEPLEKRPAFKEKVEQFLSELKEEMEGKE